MQAVRTFLNEQLITRGGVSNICGIYRGRFKAK